MLSMKVLAIAALCFCHWVAALCPNDETSLMQMKTVVNHGKAMDDPVDWKAEADAMPDHLDDGKVTSAYGANMAKVGDSIAKDAAEDIEFENTVKEQRAASAQKAIAEVKSQEAAARGAFKRDQEAVREVATNHRSTINEAITTVDDAKEAWEAHEIKKAQAQEAAIVGSLEGRDQGEEQAADMVADRNANWANQAQDKQIEQEEEAIAAHKAAVKEEINKETADQAAQEEAMAARNQQKVNAAKIEAAADSSVAQTAIEGPEGLNNQIIAEEAASAADAYARQALKSKEHTDVAASAAWPKGDWPEEPEIGLSLMSDDPVDWKAMKDAMPDNLDDGCVTCAYEQNMAKVSDAITADAASDISFEDQVKDARSREGKRVDAKIKSQNAAAESAFKADQNAVQEAAVNHRNVVNNAVDTINDAKENWEAHEIKKAQAQDAAIIGSLQGQDKGTDEAANMEEDRDDAWSNAAEDKRIKEEREALEANAAAVRDAINKRTAERAKYYEDYVNRRAEDVKDAKEKVAADASIAQTDIEGPEGLNNQVITDSADAEVDGYQRAAMKNQGQIQAFAHAGAPSWAVYQENCYKGNGANIATMNEDGSDYIAGIDIEACKELCLKTDNCQAVTYTTSVGEKLLGEKRCYGRKDVNIFGCYLDHMSDGAYFTMVYTPKTPMSR